MKLAVAFVITLFSLRAVGYGDGDIKDANQRQEFRDIAGELRCPTCTGLSVLDSDAEFSVQIKDRVKEQVAAGKSKDEILTFFVERYGPWILREPPKQGFNALAWAVPIAFLILGPILVWLFVWRRRQPFNTLGVRPTDVILKEMEHALSLRKTAMAGQNHAGKRQL